MKKLLILILTLALLLPYLVSCAELINTEAQEVDATVTNVYYKKKWVQMIYNGKTMMPIVHRAQYKVTLTYENITLTVDDEEFYNTYKDSIGSTVKCDLITKHYDDGTVRQILKLKEN
jgi:hypothetical protein